MTKTASTTLFAVEGGTLTKDGDDAWAGVEHHLVVCKIPDEEPVMKSKVRGM